MKNFLIVTLSYWSFTLTDGALRMLVLFHFYKLGYSPIILALLFVLYELAGIFANIVGGWLATRYGIQIMLKSGLGLQIVSLLSLSLLGPSWDVTLSVIWVLLAQGLAGIAKDITKTASKSAIKILSPDSNNQLFRWVAWFTGSKNAVKGLGFFIGGLLLGTIGFQYALWSMAFILGLMLVICSILLPSDLGISAASRTVRELLSKSSGVNIIAAARIFMFGARDVWFVVGLPVFLYKAGWDFWAVGGFLAIWTIGYGFIQSVAPTLLKRSQDGLSKEVPEARLWIVIMIFVPASLLIAFAFHNKLFTSPDLLVVTGLIIFGIPFALNSSLHSYLILAYAGSKKAAEDVGFYYAGNAVGRLIGTLLSGILFQSGGLVACIIGSLVMLMICGYFTFRLPIISNKN